MAPRGRPDLIIGEIRREPGEQQISYCVAIGYALSAILAREQRPEDVEELLKIAAAAGAIKHIAQALRERELK